jgi:hypothetical protein
MDDQNNEGRLILKFLLGVYKDKRKKSLEGSRQQAEIWTAMSIAIQMV